MQDEIEKKIKIFSSKIRKKIWDLSFYAGSSSSHFGGAPSSADIVATLFSSVMKFDKKNFIDENRDRFILSKGHGCMVYYAALNILGIVSEEQLKTFEKVFYSTKFGQTGYGIPLPKYFQEE